MIPERSSYPPMVETDRMIEAAKTRHTQAIGEFLDWASGVEGPGAVLCVLRTDPDTGRSAYLPLGMPTGHLLAQYTKIDMDKVEQERRALLEHVRKINRGEKS